MVNGEYTLVADGRVDPLALRSVIQAAQCVEPESLRRWLQELERKLMAMSTEVMRQIQELVDLETTGWNTKNPDLFLSMIHPDMVWPWPPTADAHDPIDWVFVLGRFDRERWRRSWQEIFDTHDLIRNQRDTVRIEISTEGDGAFAVVDIDTLWRHKTTGEDVHWKGRVCKTYTKLSTGEWKFYFQTGALNFPPKTTA